MSVKDPMCLILLGECLRDGCHEDMIDEEQSIKEHMSGGKEGFGRAVLDLAWSFGAEARQRLGGIRREITKLKTVPIIVTA